MVKPDRIACEVPHCRRTAPAAKYDPGTIIMCGKHWRLGSKTLRRRHSRLNREYKRQFGDTPFWKMKAGSSERIHAARLDRVLHRLWHRIKDQAIERAGGI